MSHEPAVAETKQCQKQCRHRGGAGSKGAKQAPAAIHSDGEVEQQGNLQRSEIPERPREKCERRKNISLRIGEEVVHPFDPKLLEASRRYPERKLSLIEDGVERVARVVGAVVPIGSVVIHTG